MRSIILPVAVLAATLAVTLATPNMADAQGWRWGGGRGYYNSYYYPSYAGSYYTPGYSYSYGTPWTGYYSAPSYYAGSTYYAPSYGSYYAPGWGGYRTMYYAPSVTTGPGIIYYR